MTTSGEDITGLVRQRVIGRLTDRESVTFPLIGTFTPILNREYVLEREADGYELCPPSVSLAFRADPFLLDASRYILFDFSAPHSIVPGELVRDTADFFDQDERVVSESLYEELSTFLTQLFRGRRVALLGLGDFFVTEDSGRLLTLNFEPSKDLTDSLNHPFSVYSPISIPGSAVPEGIEVLSSVPSEYRQRFAIVEKEKNAPTLSPDTDAPLPVVSESPDTSSEEERHTEKFGTDQKEIAAQAKREISHGPKKKRRYYLPYGLGLVAVLAVALYLLFPKEASAPIPEVVQKDTVPAIVYVEPVEAAPVALPKDTISPGETLVKLARRYYGLKEYWVYLYLHNKDLIRNPDNVPVGTILEIPDLKVFDLKEDREAAVREANDWAYLIQTGKYTDYATQRPDLPSNRQNIHQ